MTYYAVIDTNVIVSALLNHDSIPGTIITKCYDGEIVPVLNKEILDEYMDVLRRNKFSFDESEVTKTLSFFKKILCI